MSNQYLCLTIRLLVGILYLGILSTKAIAGYTHSYTWKETPDPETLTNCIVDMQKVVDARRKMVAGPDGQGKPVVEVNGISFNGIGENAHEPFDFPGGEEFNFCKTQAKPYDDVVVACLCVARDHFSPEILELESDGEGDPRLFLCFFSRICGLVLVGVNRQDCDRGRFLWLGVS